MRSNSGVGVMTTDHFIINRQPYAGTEKRSEPYGFFFNPVGDYAGERGTECGELNCRFDRYESI